MGLKDNPQSRVSQALTPLIPRVLPVSVLLSSKDGLSVCDTENGSGLGSEKQVAVALTLMDSQTRGEN